ncbi:DNA polymerase III subunit delta' [Segnochrobactraceae bacterium EtOH-i3]
MAPRGAPRVLDGVESEPDLLPDTLPPRAQTALIGHHAAEATLLDAYRSGRLPHAWLIGGPRGIGKATLAFRFARFVLAHPDPRAPDVAAAQDLSVAPDQPAARQVIAGAHPDLLHLTRPWDDKAKRFKQDLTVDAVRRIVPFFGSTAGEGGARVAIVDPADDMNPNAANALLKLLEEPPTGGLFLILAHAPGRLLPTIRSRCRRLMLEPLSEDEVSAALDLVGIDAPAASRMDAIALGEGSIRRTIALIRGGGAEVDRAFQALVARLPALDPRAVQAFADRLSGRDGDAAYEIFLDRLRAFLAVRVSQAAASGAPSSQLMPFAELWSRLDEQVDRVEGYNLDRRQLVVGLIRSLGEAARRAAL